MHEIGICQSIIETLESELEQEQYEQVREVFVKIGVLSCVDPQILEHVYGYVIADGPFQKSTLRTELVEVLANCAICKTNFEVHNYRFICPVCNTPSSTVVEGNELSIYKIIMEEPTYAKVT